MIIRPSRTVAQTGTTAYERVFRFSDYGDSVGTTLLGARIRTDHRRNWMARRREVELILELKLFLAAYIETGGDVLEES